jgi:hypothetical protein
MISNANPDPRLSSGPQARAVISESQIVVPDPCSLLSAAILSKAPGNAGSGGAEITAAPGAYGGFPVRGSLSREPHRSPVTADSLRGLIRL